ncbi:MAG: hypothetical protein ACYCQI_01445 [Gammaproteobacteria bacterium]
MTAARQKSKIESQDTIVRAVAMPNGNILSLHLNDGRFGPLTVTDRVSGKIIAKSSINLIEYCGAFSCFFSDVEKFPALCPLSDEEFFILPRLFPMHISRFKIQDNNIVFMQKSSRMYEKVFIAQDKTLFGSISIQRKDFKDYGQLHSIDPETLEVINTSPIKIKINGFDITSCWTIMPSGRIVSFQFDEDAEMVFIGIYNDILDKTPTKELTFRDWTHGSMGGESQALAENIIIYSLGLKDYIIHHLETQQTCRLSTSLNSGYTFAPISKDKTLICVQNQFYVLDHEKMTVDKMTFDIDKTCTSILSPIRRGAIRCHNGSQGEVFLPYNHKSDNNPEWHGFIFDDNHHIHIVKDGILPAIASKKDITEAIMAGIPKFSRSLSGIVSDYFGPGLFSVTPPRVLEDKSDKNENPIASPLQGQV